MNEVSHHLLEEIDRKDRRFRFFQSLFFFLVAIMLGFLLYASLQQSQSNQQVIENQAANLKALNEAAQKRSVQINDLQKHIDCVVALFQQPNRATLRISDLENCSLEQLQQSSSASGGSTGSTKSGSVNVPPSSNSQTQQGSAPVLSAPTPIQGEPVTPQAPNTPDFLNTKLCLPFLQQCASVVL